VEDGQKKNQIASTPFLRTDTSKKTVFMEKYASKLK
jgi:hypothetical protein